MKMILRIVLLVALPALGKADYQIIFNTFNSSLNNPAYHLDGTTPLSGADGFVGQLYLGLDAGSLSSVRSPMAFGSGANAGYILGDAGLPIQNPSIVNDTVAFYQLRVWDVDEFNAFENAQQTDGALIAFSSIESVLLRGYDPVSESAPVSGLPVANLHSGFSLQVVPEPSVCALLAFGTLCGFSKKRRSVH